MGVGAALLEAGDEWSEGCSGTIQKSCSEAWIYSS